MAKANNPIRDMQSKIRFAEKVMDLANEQAGKSWSDGSTEYQTTRDAYIAGFKKGLALASRAVRTSNG